MTSVDALTAALLQTERELDELGWDQPDLLFTVHGPGSAPKLRYLLQLPGDPAERLQDLLDAGARVRDDALGLVLAASVGPELDFEEMLALPLSSTALEGDVDAMASRLTAAWGSLPRPATDGVPTRALACVLRDGLTVVIARRAGESARIVQELPAPVGDHGEVTTLVTRLLVGDGVPLQRTPLMGARAKIA